MNNDMIQFMASFSGRRIPITVPVPAVIALYGKESGQGMFFAEQILAEAAAEPKPAEASVPPVAERPQDNLPPNPPAKPPTSSTGKRSHLRVVK